MSDKQTGKPGLFFRILKWSVAVAGLVLMIAWTGGVFHPKVQAAKLAYRPGKPLPDKAKTYTVHLKKIAPRIDVVGTVASEENVHLSARISAYVSKVNVSAGTAVKKGQVLIELDSRDIDEKVAAAEVNLKQTQTEYQRTLNLYKKNAATEQSLTAAESMFNSAKAQLAEVKVMLTYTKIRSPINGIVTDRRVEVGDLANPGQTLLSVYDPINMRIEVPVPVRLIEKLSLNQEVDINLDRPNRPFKGRVVEIVSEIDPLSRTQKVKVHIDNRKGDILPGTFGRVWVREDSKPAILIPAAALMSVGQLEMVYVVKNDRIEKRMVKSGPAYGDAIEILSGLSQGDVILVSPLEED
jgi:RND family efflux transporter MFP subunit